MLSPVMEGMAYMTAPRAHTGPAWPQQAQQAGYSQLYEDYRTAGDSIDSTRSGGRGARLR